MAATVGEQDDKEITLDQNHLWTQRGGPAREREKCEQGIEGGVPIWPLSPDLAASWMKRASRIWQERIERSGRVGREPEFRERNPEAA